MWLKYGAAPLLVLSALAVPVQAAWSAEAPVNSRASSVHNENFLFTLQAAQGNTSGGSSEQRPFNLTLTGVGPVTKFSDRPFRDAFYISPFALHIHWLTWFAKTPPNAVLTYSTNVNSAPASIVVTLTKPRYEAHNRVLSFKAVRLYRDANPNAKNAASLRPRTPARFIKASLFIDGSNSTSGSVPNDVVTFGSLAGQDCNQVALDFYAGLFTTQVTPAQSSAALKLCQVT